MEQQVIISIENLKKEYKIKSTKLFEKAKCLNATDGINLEIFEGEALGVIGESGCGKSTLGNMLANLITPSSGKITFMGKDIGKISGKEDRQYRREMQIILQDPYSALNPKKKIGWLLEEALTIHKIGNPKERKLIVKDTLRNVGLDSSYLSKFPHELSGGQRQRVNIAMALILNPRFIVADEVVSALDVSVQAQILNLLKSLQLKYKLTYLFITHDLNVAYYMSNRIAVMYLGKIVELGTAEQIYFDSKHPYTKALFSASPSLEDEGRKKIVLKGDVPNPIDIPSGCPFHTRCPEAKAVCSEKIPPLNVITDGRSVSCHFAK